MTTSRFITSGSPLYRTARQTAIRAPLRTPQLPTFLAKRSLSTTPRTLSASVAPSAMTVKNIDINPPNWDTRPPRERYEITPFGYLMPRIYIPMCEVFPLPEDANKEEIVKNLSKGLEATIDHFPFLAGVLNHDAENGCYLITTDKEHKVQLFVRDLTDELPSFAEMEANDFPSQAFGATEVIPKHVRGGPYFFSTEDSLMEQAVCGFQVTFIKGGVIISISTHHNVSDATGLDDLFKEWARNSAAFTAGKTPEASPYHYKVSGTSYKVPKPSPTKLEALVQKHAEVINHGSALDPIEPPNFMARLWHFPRTSLAELKKQVAATLPEGAWVSTYDVTIAVMWLRLIRARAHIRDTGEDHIPLLTHAINARSNLFPPIGNEHIACGTTITRVEPPTLDTIKEFNPVNIGKIALDVRDSIRETRNCSWLHSEMQCVEGHEDKRFITSNLKHFRDLDCCFSSWRDLSTYHTHDFGFGLPHALRMPDPQNEGFIFIYPSRAHLKPADSDEGMEMVVLLDEESQKRLMKDEVLLKYAQPRGV